MFDELHHVASSDLCSLMHHTNAEYRSVNVLSGYTRALPLFINKTNII